MSLLRIQTLETIADLSRSLKNGLVALIHTDDQGNVAHSIVTAHNGLAKHLLGKENPLDGLTVDRPGIATIALPYDAKGAQVIDPETLTAECVCVASAQNPLDYYPSIGDEQSNQGQRQGATQYGHELGSGLHVVCTTSPSGSVSLDFEATTGALIRHADIAKNDPLLDCIEWETSDNFTATPGYLVLSTAEGAAFSPQSLKGTSFVFDMQIPAMEIVDHDTNETFIFVTK